jgi:hypothetical protein
VTRQGRPLAGARVTFAGASATTTGRGRATLWPPLSVPGRFKALARDRRSYGVSALVDVGL